MVSFEDSIILLDNFGLYDVVLPFLFIFTIVFAVLEKTEIFGKEKKKINAMIAFIFGFILISSLKYVNIVQDLISNTALLMVAGTLLLIVVGTLGLDNISDNKYIKWSSIVMGLVGVLIILGNNFSIWNKINIPWTIIKGASGVVFSFATFILIIWIIVRDKKTNTSDNNDNNKRPQNYNLKK